MDAWAEDSNFWVVRTAILHQLRFKSATDSERLFRYCGMHAGDAEFFIRKAIGWALREYSKTDAAAVRRFVAEHEGELSGLSKREALLWLNGGRKGSGRRE
jgi:3-methyladenine DNA glycosylase AlkD